MQQHATGNWVCVCTISHSILSRSFQMAIRNIVWKGRLIYNSAFPRQGYEDCWRICLMAVSYSKPIWLSLDSHYFQKIPILTQSWYPPQGWQKKLLKGELQNPYSKLSGIWMVKTHVFPVDIPWKIEPFCRFISHFKAEKSADAASRPRFEGRHAPVRSEPWKHWWSVNPMEDGKKKHQIGLLLGYINVVCISIYIYITV